MKESLIQEILELINKALEQQDITNISTYVETLLTIKELLIETKD